MRDKLSTGYSCLHQTLKKIFSKTKFIYTYSVSENVYLYNFVCNFEMPICFRLMLLSVLWQIFSHWWFEIIDGRCYCHLLSGICCPLCSFVADVISHCSNWNCYFNLFVLFGGWCYCQMSSWRCFTTTEAWVGWCYCQVADVKPLNEHKLADVIAKWQMLKLLQGGCVVAEVNYFSFSSEVLTRTLSQTCGRWYLPTFLLRDGSLTLMYRASFILIWFKASVVVKHHPLDIWQ